MVYIPRTGKCVTTVHAKFNEDIPDYRIEYFKELEKEMMLLEQKKLLERKAQVVYCKFVDENNFWRVAHFNSWRQKASFNPESIINQLLVMTSYSIMMIFFFIMLVTSLPINNGQTQNVYTFQEALSTKRILVKNK